MTKLLWDAVGERIYEAGVSNAVLFLQAADGSYPQGEAWNGLVNITEKPSGAEANPLYANNEEYLKITSPEKFSFSVEAYTVPDGWAACDGSLAAMVGVQITAQSRQKFGLAYRTGIGNDVDDFAHGYKIHLVYNAQASVSEHANATVNETVEAQTLTWECSTTKVPVTGFKPTAHIVVDSTKLEAVKLAALEDAIYGTDAEEAYLPSPDEVLALLAAAI